MMSAPHERAGASDPVKRGERRVDGMDRDELREEMMAILAANRELSAEADEALVDSLLAKMASTAARRGRSAELRALYGRLVPVGPWTVAAIAGAQGAVMVVLGRYLLERVLAYSYYMDGYMRAWAVFGVLWLAEVLVTIAVLSILSPSHGDVRQRARHKRLSAG
jgi:hypothetical protein